MNGAPPEFLREEDVKTILAKYLQSKGFTNIKVVGERGQGDDIVAVSPQERTLRIEVKGDGYDNAFGQQGICDRVASAVFFQLRKLHANKRRNGTDIYGVAFPENRWYRLYLNEDMMDFLVGLELLVFFVRRVDSVELCGNDALLT
jgi:hypothetical protein